MSSKTGNSFNLEQKEKSLKSIKRKKFEKIFLRKWFLKILKIWPEIKTLVNIA